MSSLLGKYLSRMNENIGIAMQRGLSTMFEVVVCKKAYLKEARIICYQAI